MLDPNSLSSDSGDPGRRSPLPATGQETAGDAMLPPGDEPQRDEFASDLPGTEPDSDLLDSDPLDSLALPPIEFLSEVEPTAAIPETGAVGNPPVQLRRDSLPAIHIGPPPIYRFVWLFCLLGAFFAVSLYLPRLAEQVQYGITRGRQQAEYETAVKALDEVPLRELSRAYQWVSQKVGPSVVHINIASEVSSSDDESLPQFLRRRRSQGQGSGVIVDEAGYILTNRHVIVGSNAIEVKLSDGRARRANVVGVDELTDLAVLKIDADNLTAADFGDSEDMRVGEMVWALGSPFGLERSITFGILSAKHRSQNAGTPYQDFLQTDAAVNPGNSGGPLVNAKGRVIGINTAIVGEAYQGISFAVPSGVAQQIYHRIRSEGQVTRGWLGVRPAQVSSEDAERLGLEQASGALVELVTDNYDGSPSPASDAGIQVDDVVVRWNDRPIRSPSDLFSQVGMTTIGTKVEVIVIRGGSEVSLQVAVGERRSD